MPINTVRNNTGEGAVLELWDAGVMLSTLDDGQAVHNVPITITSVTLGEVAFQNKRGSFQDGASYSASYQRAVAPNPAMVTFQIGDEPGPGDVRFS